MFTWDTSGPLLFFSLAATNLALLKALFSGYKIVVEKTDNGFSVYLTK